MNWYNQIEPYLDGTLSDEAKRGFERQVQKDAALKEQLDLARAAIEVLRDKEAIAFRQRLLSLKNKNSEVHSSAKKSIWPWVVLLFLILGGVWLVFKLLKDDTDPEVIFASHFADIESLAYEDIGPYINRSPQAEETGTLAKKWAVFLQLCLEKKPAQAMDALEAIQQDFPDFLNPEGFRFYLGYIAFCTGDYQEVLDLFYSQKEVDSYTGRSMWLMAGAYLKLGKTSLAKKTLQQLTEYGKGPFAERARQVLDTW